MAIKGLPLLSGHFDPRRKVGRPRAQVTAAEMAYGLANGCGRGHGAGHVSQMHGNGGAYVGCQQCDDFVSVPVANGQVVGAPVWASSIASQQRRAMRLRQAIRGSHAPASSAATSTAQAVIHASQQQALGAMAAQLGTAGVSTRVQLGQPCPVPGCGGHGVQRHNSVTGKPFVGCSQYPATKCPGRVLSSQPQQPQQPAPAAPVADEALDVAAPVAATMAQPVAAPVAGGGLVVNAQAFAVVAKSLEGEAATRHGLEVHERMLQLWLSAAAGVRQVAGKLSPDECIAAGYALAVTERESDEAQQHALEVYRQSGFAADPVKSLRRLSVEEVIRAAWTARLPLYLSGRPGVGKTYAAMHTLRALSGREPVRTAGGMVVRESFMGQRDLLESNGASVTSYTPSPLVLAYMQGSPYVLDEADKVRPDCWDALTELLETWSDDWTVEGVTYRRAPGFAFVATGNTLGDGGIESVRYAGTQPINQAIRTRMLFFTVPGADWRERAKRLVQHAGTVGITFTAEG